MIADGDSAATNVAGEWQWDVALSFAGADRHYVKQVASVLKDAGVRYFYDDDQQTKMWGKHLGEELLKIYGRQAAVVVVFVSAAYAAGDWTQTERRAAISRAARERREYVLPARFDDTPLDGLDSAVVWIDLRKLTARAFAEILLGKLTELEICTPKKSNSIRNRGKESLSETKAPKRRSVSPNKSRRATALIALAGFCAILVGAVVILKLGLHFTSLHASASSPPVSKTCGDNNRNGNETWTLGGQCVGFRLSGQPFGDDKRLTKDERLIFRQNECAAALSKTYHRPLVGLVYFAGLTESGWSNSAADEVESVLLQQWRHNGPLSANDQCSVTDTGLDPLKIIIANGGAKMAKAPQVTAKLIPYLDQHSEVLAVIGMDRSVTEVKTALHDLGAHEPPIPVVATNLTGDAIGVSTIENPDQKPTQNTYPTYRQMLASNHPEATVLALDALAAPSKSGGNRTVVIAYPAGSGTLSSSPATVDPTCPALPDFRNSPDVFVSTLVPDVRNEFCYRKGVTTYLRAWNGAGPRPDPAQLCPPGDAPVDAIIYLGRNEEFQAFLQATQQRGGPCRNRLAKARIIGDGAISRYVSERFAERTTVKDIPSTIDYESAAPRLVANGQACRSDLPSAIRHGIGEFCLLLAELHQYLDHSDPKTVWWPDRMAAAYDAIDLLTQTALPAGSSPNRSTVADQMARPNGVRGVPKGVTTPDGYGFNISRLGTAPLGIVRVVNGLDTGTATRGIPNLCIVHLSPKPDGQETAPTEIGIDTSVC